MKSNSTKELKLVKDDKGKHIVFKYDNVENIISPKDIEELDIMILIGMSPDDIRKAVAFFEKE